MTTFAPTTGSSWATPFYAAVVVAIVAVCLLLIVVIATGALHFTTGDTPTPDPNAATISALASAAIAALTSLTAAYFGIKVATEQSAQSAATAAAAVQFLGNSTPNFGNSSTNGNPSEGDL